MRNTVRKTHREDEDESVFISMTDMTVSFLFIVILLLAYFASRYSEESHMVPRSQYDTVVAENQGLKQELERAKSRISDFEERLNILEEKLAREKAKVSELEKRIAELTKKDPLEEYLSKAAAARQGILIELKGRLKLDFPDLLIEISAESDALRFQGEGLFGKDESHLTLEKRRIVASIAARLDELLPSYTFGGLAKWSQQTNPSAAVIEAVQIEGHTDADGEDLRNLSLSTDRANATFVAMLKSAPNLTLHLNYKGQPVLSVAGYGEMRPVASNETIQGKATNRRIDLRIIMHTPGNVEEVDRIKTQLSGGEEARR